MHRKTLLIAFSLFVSFALFSCSEKKSTEQTSTQQANIKTATDTPVVLASEQADRKTVAGSNDSEHPLDKEFQECVEAHPANLGVRDCLAQFLEKWDAELNRLYKALRNTPSEKQKEALKTSQLAWIKFRDAEFAYIEAQLGGMEGSMYPNMILRRKMRVVRARVLELYDYREFQKTME